MIGSKGMVMKIEVWQIGGFCKGEDLPDLLFVFKGATQSISHVSFKICPDYQILCNAVECSGNVGTANNHLRNNIFKTVATQIQGRLVAW